MPDREELELRRRIQQGGMAPAEELQIRRRLQAITVERVEPQAVPSPSSALESAEAMAGSFGVGANRGLASVIGAPVDLMSLGLRSVGLPGAEDAFGGSQSIQRGLNALGLETTQEGFETLTGRPATRGERIAGRVGQEVGAGAIAAAPVLGIARATQAAAPAATTAGRIGQAIVNPARTAPAATATTDVGLTALSGAGAGTAREIAPGSTMAELAGQFSPLLLPALGAATIRGITRGGTVGQRALQDSIDDFAMAGVTPSVGQGTGATVAQGLETTLGSLPGGGSVMLRASRNTAERIGNRVEMITNGLARNADPESAGRTIQRGLVGDGDSFLGRFHDVSERLFNDIDQFIPRDTAVSVDNSRAAFAELSTPIAGAENLSEILLISPQIARAAQAFTADVGQAGQLTYGALKDVRSAIGRLLTSSALVDDIPRASLKRIYASLSSDMEAAAQAAGAGASRAFERANGYYRSGLARLENVIQPLIGSRVPERIFRALELSGRDGATTIRTIYRSLNPEERAVTTGLILRRMGHATPGQQGAEGAEFSTETFLTNWNRIAPDSKDVLFNQPQFTGLRRDLDAVARTTERIREGSRVLANPSGTATRQTQAAGLALLGAGGFQAAQGSTSLLTTVLMGMGAANVGSRLMTSPAFVRWLARSTQLSPRQIPIHIGRLATTMQNADAAIAQEVVELLKVISPATPTVPVTSQMQVQGRSSTTQPLALPQ